MFPDDREVLHIVDSVKRFSAATYLGYNGINYGHSAEGILLALIDTWCTMYTGYPNRLRTDQGSAFTSDR